MADVDKAKAFKDLVKEAVAEALTEKEASGKKTRTDTDSGSDANKGFLDSLFG
jgi:hypothetical protein